MCTLKDQDRSSYSCMDKVKTISDLKELTFIPMFRMPLIVDIHRTQPSGKDFTVCKNAYCSKNSRSLQRTWQYKDYKDYNLRKNAGIQNENSWNNRRPVFFVCQSLLCEGQAYDKKLMQTYWWYNYELLTKARRVRQISKEWWKVSLNKNKNKPIRGWTWFIYFHFIFQ